MINLKDIRLSDLRGIARGLTRGKSSEEFVRQQRAGWGKRECVWTTYPNEYGIYNTSCKDSLVFNEDGVAENRFSFCPFCGGKLIACEYKEKQND